MNKHTLENTWRLLSYTVFVLAALVIIVDFILPGKVVNDEIIKITRERQQYYNAAGNYHYSYELVAKKHRFQVKEEFAALAKDQEKIEYSVSRIFKEVNWYRLLTSEKGGIYSLRIISGFIIPFMVIVSIGAAYRFRKKTGTLVFVLMALLIADLVFLML